MSSRPRILVAGAGSIGERHVRCFLGTGRVDVAICEPNAERAHAVAERYGISRVCAAWDQALADRPTAAVIATPAHLHIGMARQGVEQGCLVLIDLPVV